MTTFRRSLTFSSSSFGQNVYLNGKGLNKKQMQSVFIGSTYSWEMSIDSDGVVKSSLYSQRKVSWKSIRSWDGQTSSPHE